MTQVYNLPITRAFKNDGSVAPGYKLFLYATGTTTKKTAYSDSALTTPVTNPLIADANGEFIQVFLEGTGADYKAVLAPDTDTNPPTSPIWTADPIDSFSFNINSFDPRPAQHWGTTTNTASAYQLTPDTAIASYTDDLLFSLQAHVDCNADVTLAIADVNNPGSFLTAQTIKKYDGAGGKINLKAGDMQGGQTYVFRHDGSNPILLNPNITEKLILGLQDVTIASGAITYISADVRVDGEGAAADDLDTISGGLLGDVICLRSKDSGRDITIKHGTGNIITPFGADITLFTTNDRATLQYDGTNWIVLHTKRPGETVQVVNTQTGAVATGTTVIPVDDTIPQNTEGTEFMTLAVTPTNASNKLKIDVVLYGFNSVNNRKTAALFQDSTADALATASSMGSAAYSVTTGNIFTHYMTAGTTSSTTFKVRAGGESGTFTFNGLGGARVYGGTMASSITITEIQT